MSSATADLLTLKFVTLDVFTKTPYEGNPLALVKIPSSVTVTQQQKQTIAREFNLSETVFLHQQADPKTPEWKIDIFITTAELPFAGHPTIGAAYYALSQWDGTGKEGGVLVTKSGRIAITEREGGGGVVVEAKIAHNVHIHDHTFATLSRPLPWVSASEKIAEAERNASLVSIVKGMTFLLVELSSLEELAAVKIGSVEDGGFKGLLDQRDGWDAGFVGRYYFVVVGGGDAGTLSLRTRMLEVSFEDPATGSAACSLASYLALSGRGGKFGIEQGVEMGRRSVIGVEVEVSGGGERKVESVKLSGSAVQVMEGSLRI